MVAVRTRGLFALWLTVGITLRALASDPFAGNLPEDGNATLAARIDAILEPLIDQSGPGYAVGIIQGRDLLVARGYGLANLETQEPITADTAMNLASLSKQFTAAAIALELERGSLELDDALNEHWPGLPGFMECVQIDHLLYMTSGIPEYYTLPSPRGGWASEDEFSVDDAIGASFAAGRLDYAPGTDWSYSNINYQLLARLVEKLSGKPFHEYMRESVFEPLMMTHSWVDAPLRVSLDYKAAAYERTSFGDWREAPRLSPHFGGSGVYASVADLARWSNELHFGGILGDRFRRQMTATRRFEHDKENDAFGLVLGTYRGEKTLWYAGSDYGVSTYMVLFPERQATFICLANFASGNCTEVARRLIDATIAH